MPVNVDIQELKRLRDRVKAVTEFEIEEFNRDVAKELANRLLSKAIRLTPVDTGRLRKGWTGEKQQAVQAYVDSLTINKVGDTYTIELTNPVYYAKFVEYGHRTSNHASWVPGAYMMTIAEQEVKSLAPRLIQERIEAKLREVFYG